MAQYLRYDVASRTNNAFDLKIRLASADALVPAITSTNSFTGTVGVAFSNTVTASGSMPIIFRGTNLPAGLSIATNGAISGTPTTAGTNTATLTASNAYGSTNQSAFFYIAKGTPVISNWPSASPITYGQAVSNSVLSGGVANPTGNFTWTVPTNRPNAGSNSVNVTFRPSASNNYNSLTSTVALLVNKATPTITLAPAASTIIYGQTLANSTLSGGTASIPGIFAFTTPTTGPNAGASTQSVTFTPTDTANYSSVTTNVSVIVSKATPTITLAPTASPIPQGQSLSGSALSGGSASVPGTFSFAAPSLFPPSGYSSQTVAFTPTDTINYQSVLTNVTVTARVTPIQENVLYGTFAGLTGSPGSNDGKGANARFASPQAVATDAIGNVYVADTGNHTIRKISLDGTVTTFAGTAGQSGYADGTGAAARFNGPKALAVGVDGTIYVADTENHLVRKISPDGVVTTLAGIAGLPGTQDGTGTGASFYRPMGVAADASGNVFVADTGNHTLRKITAAGRVTRVAGQVRSAGFADGGVASSRLNSPMGLAVGADGSIWVADSNNYLIRKLTGTTLSTVAGSAGQSGMVDGTGSAARLAGPVGLALDFNGNLYFSEPNSQILRKCTPSGEVSFWAGQISSAGVADGSYNAAKFYRPSGLAVDSAGNLYIADMGNGTIRIGRVTAVSPVWAHLQPRWVTESNLPVPVADLVLDGDANGVTATASSGFEVRATANPTKLEVWTTGACDYEATLFVTFQVVLSRSGGTPTTLSGLLVMQNDRNEDADGDGLPEWQEEDIYGTSDLKKDSDGDGVNDSVEIADGTNSQDPDSFSALSKGLIAYYAFSGNAKDLSGGGHSGQVIDCAFGEDRNGITNQALRLNQAGSRVVVPSSENLQIGTSDLTLTAWIKCDGFMMDRYFVSKYYGSGAGYGFGTGQNGGPYAFLGREGSNALDWRGGTDFNDGDWHFVAATYDRDGQLRMFVDGRPVPMAGNDGNGVSIGSYQADIQTSAPLLIGRHEGGTSFRGWIDEVRIYNRALTPGEIASLYVEWSGGSLPQDWISYGRSFYTTVPGPTWEEAEVQAVRLGGHLVTLNDQAEDRFIYSQYGEGYWIGLTDRDGEGIWRWASGEPVTYTNWINGEPNNNGGRQNYAWYWWGWGGRWDDHILEGRWPWVPSEVMGGIAEIPRPVRGREPVLQLSGLRLVEGGPGRPIGTVNVTDPDGSPERVRLTLCGRDAAFFRLTGNPARILETAATIRYESLQRSFEFQILGVDPQGNSTLLPVAASVEDDPANNRSIRLGRSMYTFVPGPSWDEAEAQAQALGGHLVTLNDAVEDRFLYQFFGDGYWIGLTDRHGEGNWQWASGEPVTYTNWWSGEPNNNGGRQNYAWYWWGRGGKWDDHIQEGRWPWVSTEVLGGIAEIPQNTGLEISVTGRTFMEGPMARDILPIQILDPGGDPAQVVLTLEGLDASLFRISTDYPRKLVTALTTNFEGPLRSFSLMVHAVNSRGHHYVLPLELSLLDDPADNTIRRGLSTYTLVPGPTWDEAEAQAVALGGHLVTVNDSAEDVFLNTWAGEGFWIGLTDRNGEGNWEWVSGETVTYTNWLTGEPNNNGGRQNYGWYWWGRGGKWDDHIQEGRWSWVPVEVIGGIAEIRADPGGDEDGDGLSNGQELTLGTDPYQKDTDGDGQADATELAAGTDPKNPNSRLTLSLNPAAIVPTLTAQSTGSHSETPAGPAGILLTWPSVPGKVYDLQKSTDLRNWSSVSQIQAEPEPAKQTTVQVSAPDPKAFYRVGVQIPNP